MREASQSAASASGAATPVVSMAPNSSCQAPVSPSLHAKLTEPSPGPSRPRQNGSPALSGVEAPEVTPMVMGPSGSQFSVSTSSPCASLWVTWAAPREARQTEVSNKRGSWMRGQVRRAAGRPLAAAGSPAWQQAGAGAHLVGRHVDARRRVHPEGWDALHLTNLLHTACAKSGLVRGPGFHATAGTGCLMPCTCQQQMWHPLGGSSQVSSRAGLHASGTSTASGPTQPVPGVGPACSASTRHTGPASST